MKLWQLIDQNPGNSFLQSLKPYIKLESVRHVTYAYNRDQNVDVAPNGGHDPVDTESAKAWLREAVNNFPGYFSDDVEKWIRSNFRLR